MGSLEAQLLDNYLLASDLMSASNDRKKALLLHSLGAEGQRIFYTLPVLSPTVSAGKTTSGPTINVYEQAFLILEKHFSLIVNIVAERFVSANVPNN